LLGFKYIAEDGRITDKEEMLKYIKEVQIPSFLNSALCYIKLNDHKTAIQFCDSVLEIDDTNSKALYRRALCHQELGNLEGAAQDVKELLKIEPHETSVQKLNNDIKKKIKNQREREKEINKRIIHNLNFHESQPEAKEVDLSTDSSTSFKRKSIFSKIFSIKDMLMENIKITKQDIKKKIKCKIVENIKMIGNNIKLIVLLPLNLVSETCCKRRLPSQFYKVGDSLKTKSD